MKKDDMSEKEFSLVIASVEVLKAATPNLKKLQPEQVEIYLGDVLDRIKILNDDAKKKKDNYDKEE
ncbi:MAG: hypothetical protein A2086_17225 [Spirochaetes bacterium GWD1_27_9]|nr:MAG: hypothetical protein A2Z98_12390 [Spirochaetes bacterium GWB1_27_13]OHD42463.1 MAG: hypothetical protein A2086_17225 [Spirochaetes bacterium GWD1_27_9]